MANDRRGKWWSGPDKGSEMPDPARLDKLETKPTVTQ